MRYKSIIIDDEPLAHDVLKEHFLKNPEIQYCGSFYNAYDALMYLRNKSIDIIFLDIQMPEMSGIEFLKEIDNMPVAIFTTAHRDYALEGYELGVMDYLVKPVSYERFNIAISRVIDFLNLKRNDNTLFEKKDIATEKTLTIKSGTKHILIPLLSISHIQGLKDYAIFYAGKQKYVVKGYIKIINNLLPQGYFTRVHKSFIVANSKIKLLNRGRIEFDNYQIPIGRLYKPEIEKFFTP